MVTTNNNFDVIIIGGGAAGLMCAISAGKRKRRVLILDSANKVGRKILMSGGGRCNFTNYYINSDNYISHNKHFCKSALSRFTQWDFIELVNKHKIPFHEKTLGQLFCNNKSKDIVDMLIAESHSPRTTLNLNMDIIQITQTSAANFIINTNKGAYTCESLVIASGGLSIPSMGSSPFAYKIAEQFGINVWPTRAGLVPFTLNDQFKAMLSPLSGIGIASLVSTEQIAFRDYLLFTHRGLSGPAILQISSYWQQNQRININLLPDINLLDLLKNARTEQPQKQVNSILGTYLPRRIIDTLIDHEVAITKLAALSNDQLDRIVQQIHNWSIKPNGTEGYRTAEVTLGGIDCDELSSKTMATTKIPNLFFIGEAVDVTGWLGGYNFQWAWSSGWAAGQFA
ncbi:MAG: NAD(P)/FAD-dependent oxidoreductase [Legionella sp.]